MSEQQPVTTNEPGSTAPTPDQTAPQPTGPLLGTGKVQNAPSAEWISSLPEDIRGEGALKQFKDVGSLAKSYIHLNKKRNESLQVPGAEAKPEEWDAFYQKIGRPESPDKYELTLPEGVQANEGLLKGFKELAHKNGILPKQAQAALDFYHDLNKQAVDAYEKESEAAIGKLKDKWGDDFDKNVGYANAALKEFGDESISQALEGSAWGKYPPLVELLASIGKSLAPKPIEGNGAGSMRMGPKEIQARIREIESNPIILDESRKWDPTRKSLLEERSELYAKLENPQAQ